MYFDTLTMAAVADELRTTLLFGRVQRVVLPNHSSVALEVYAQRQRYQLLASAHPQFARIHLVQGKPSRGVEQATPLLLLLRKYVLGGRIIAIEHPPLERVLLLRIAREHHPDTEAATEHDHLDDRDDTDNSGAPEATGTPDQADHRVVECDLVIETMERRSNIILIDDNNTILDSIKRVTPRMSRRVILPHEVYEMPPTQTKHDPRTATAEQVQALSPGSETTLERILVKGYRGLSPQAAREVIFRVHGRTGVELHDQHPWEALAATLRDLFGGAWQPTLVQGEERPRAYAPYRITHMEGAEPQPSISAALDAFYGAQEHVTSHRQRRDTIMQLLEQARERLQHIHRQVSQELERARELEHARWEGEMIFAFLHTLEPDQQVLEVEGQRIEIDPQRGAVAAAQERFRAYNKARNTLEELPKRLRTVEHQLEGLEQLITLLELTDEREQIDQLALEAEEQGYIVPGTLESGKAKAKTRAKEKTQARKQRRTLRRKPLHLVSSDGFDIYVGRSATQNADVTFRIGRPDDVWLHVRDVPGAHVIVRSGGQDVPERTLQEAAGVAAYFSRMRHERSADVDISRRSRVRKVPGGITGLVTYRAERTLHVAPVPPWA
jgi:predicted ribosome quality control (RQC) complex YloA/Tae2 family protein